METKRNSLSARRDTALVVLYRGYEKRGGGRGLGNRKSRSEVDNGHRVEKPTTERLGIEDDPLQTLYESGGEASQSLHAASQGTKSRSIYRNVHVQPSISTGAENTVAALKNETNKLKKTMNEYMIRFTTSTTMFHNDVATQARVKR